MDEIKSVTAMWSENKPRLLTCAFKGILKINCGLKYIPLKNVAHLSDLLRVTGGRQLFPHCAAVTQRCITTFHNAIITEGCSDALLLPSTPLSQVTLIQYAIMHVELNMEDLKYGKRLIVFFNLYCPTLVTF